jgi:hypothetical protein
MIVRLVTAIRECYRDLKEQEEKRKAARGWHHGAASEKQLLK